MRRLNARSRAPAPPFFARGSLLGVSSDVVQTIYANNASTTWPKAPGVVEAASELTRGIALEVSPYAPGQPFDLEFAERLLRGGRVRLVAVSGASAVTGELLPIAALGQLTRAAGVPLLLDAAQTMGVVPLDLRTLPVDMLVFAGHKGPLAPHGIGGLWVAPFALRAIGAPEGTLRISLGPFNRESDVDAIVAAAADSGSP